MRRHMILPRLASVCLLAGSVGALQWWGRLPVTKFDSSLYMGVAAIFCFALACGLAWWAREWLFRD